MNKLEQAARQALEALVRLTNWMNDRRMIVAGAEYEAITALREALAEFNDSWPESDEHKRQLVEGQRKWLAEQAEQEPVASVIDAAESYDGYEAVIDTGDKPLPPGTKLYAAPVRTKDLTDDEIESIVDGVGAYEVGYWHYAFARAVIAADREKNK